MREQISVLVRSHQEQDGLLTKYKQDNQRSMEQMKQQISTLQTRVAEQEAAAKEQAAKECRAKEKAARVRVRMNSYPPGVLQEGFGGACLDARRAWMMEDAD